MILGYAALTSAFKTYSTASYLPGVGGTVVPIFHDRNPLTDQVRKALEQLAMVLSDQQNVEGLLDNLLLLATLIRIQCERYLENFEDLVTGKSLPTGLIRLMKKKMDNNKVF